MESAARTALTQFRLLAARRGCAAAAATARTFPVAARRARHLSSSTTTGAKGSSSSHDARAAAAAAGTGAAEAEFRKKAAGDTPEEPRRLYVVYLVPKFDVDIDVSKAAELHHGILASIVGSEEEAARCMERSFEYSQAFSAMLTDSQASAASRLPEVSGACRPTVYRLINPTMDDAEREYHGRRPRDRELLF